MYYQFNLYYYSIKIISRTLFPFNENKNIYFNLSDMKREYYLYKRLQ